MRHSSEAAPHPIPRKNQYLDQEDKDSQAREETVQANSKLVQMAVRPAFPEAK